MHKRLTNMRKRKKIYFLVSAISFCLILHVIIEVFDVPTNFIRSLPFSKQGSSQEKHLLTKDSKLNFINLTVKCSNDSNCIESELNYSMPKILIAMPTPKDFVDISKVKPKKMKNLNVGFQQPGEAFPENGPKSPKILQQRAMTSPQNSSLTEFIKTQKVRRDLMLNVCSEVYGNKSQFPMGAKQIFQNILIDREDFLSFCPIYKAASTSWSVIMMEMRGYWEEKRSKKVQIQRLVDQVFQRVSNVIAPWVTTGTTKFLIVRHPFERLVSCYRDKFEGARKIYYYLRYGESMIRKFRHTTSEITKQEIRLLLDAVKDRLEKESPVILPGNPYADPIGPTFEEFIRYVLYGRYDDEHWRPFYLHCDVCQMKFNIILRFESLSSDSLQFLEYLNRTDVAGSRWDNPTSEGSTTKEVVCKYLSQIDGQLFKILLKRYEIDFELFNYSWNQYANCTQENP